MRKTKTIAEKRFAAGAFCIALVLILLFASLYIWMEAGHECAGEECAVCAAIRWCGLVLKSSGLADAPALAAVALIVSVTAAAVSVLLGLRGKKTPVGDRVRLDN
ncbi:MAG: hypothetical protein IK082_04890 [Oscillospiraceae bacterium]|nr:hypothetical protein [Oscillospiraceae bacterium]